jgi:hypothetical protein
MSRLPGSLVCFGTALAVVLWAAPEPPPNHLSPDEQASGWKLLFDGKTTNGWEGMAGTPFPAESWAIEDGAIRTLGDNSGGDVISVKPYENFELSFDWKISPRGNSGVKYMVQKEWFNTGFRPDMAAAKRQRLRLSAIGMEYQIIDDSVLRQYEGSEKSSTGALYLLYEPHNKKVNPLGEWNQSRIVVRGSKGEHWLNGEKIAEFEFSSEEILARVEKTKFRRTPGYGIKGAGYIVLTHHNSPAWFRNIKIHEFPSGE